MRVVIQRTINASVHVNDKNIAEIDKGLLIGIKFYTTRVLENN